jgi:curli biogenesis system outer membrane secretion channel CsgG
MTLQDGKNIISIEAMDDIAVVSFGILSKSSELEQMGNVIAEMLTTSLGKTKRFDLMERGQLQKQK